MWNMTCALLKANFGSPAGKIDFITLSLPGNIKNTEGYREFVSILADAAPRVKMSSCPHKRNFFTLHDPNKAELQRLIDAYPAIEVLALEISLDFYLKDGSNDPVRLEELRNWLVHRLYPQNHKSMKERSWRKIYDEESKNIIRDVMRTKSKNTTYWGAAHGHELVRLYTKTIDNKNPVVKHCVRLEVTMFRGGCQNAGVNRLAMLPNFVIGMRAYLSRFFTIGRCIVLAKPQREMRSKNYTKRISAEIKKRVEQKKLDDAWMSFGSIWAVKHHQKVKPDSEANRWVGQGLKKLRENLMGLSVSENMAEKVAEWRGIYEVRSLADKECFE